MVKKISWNDFELEGNQENLIKQGWESFVPYGFGEFIGKAPEEVFDENYARNILNNTTFERDLSPWALQVEVNVEGVTNGELSVTQKGTPYPRVYQNLNVSEDDKYYMSVEYFVNSNEPFKKVEIAKDNSNWGGVVAIHRENEIKQDEWTLLSGISENMTHFTLRNEVYSMDEDTFISWRKPTLINLTKLFGKGNEPSKEWCDENLKYYPNWQDLPDEEKPVNAYENGYTYIQPLDNGFTRVRTKGGDTDMKLKSPNFGQLGETGTDMTISLYVENNSDSMIRFSNNLAIGGIPYPDGVKYMITVPRGYKGPAYLKGEQVGRDVELDIRSDGNIDMIVSQPEIIEGHDLNAMLVIEDLDDGREHVKIYGATKDTKLVYKGGGAVIGEPYVIESEIENLGAQLQMESTLDSVGKVIDKGINQVSIKGTTDSKDFEIGVKLRDGTI